MAKTSESHYTAIDGRGAAQESFLPALGRHSLFAWGGVRGGSNDMEQLECAHSREVEGEVGARLGSVIA